MKLTNIIIKCGAVISSALLVVSCVKDKGKEVATEATDFSNKSFVQVFNATLGSTRNYVYVDGSAVTGAAIAYGGTFPSTPSNFAITAGFRAFIIRDTLSTSTQPMMSFAENLQANSYYTIFTYDTVNAVKQKLVTNSIVIPNDTTARLRFANFAYSPFPVPAVDIFSVKRNANIFSNVSTTEVTPFIPFDSRRSDTLIVRISGSGTNLVNKTVTTSGTPPVTTTTLVPVQLIVNLTQKRSYTLVFRGGWRTDTTGKATIRTLSVFTNN